MIIESASIKLTGDGMYRIHASAALPMVADASDELPATIAPDMFGGAHTFEEALDSLRELAAS